MDVTIYLSPWFSTRPREIKLIQTLILNLKSIFYYPLLISYEFVFNINLNIKVINCEWIREP